MAGITVDGFEQKTLEEILTEIQTDQRENIDPAIDTSSSSPVGQMNGVFSNQLAEAWEVVATAYKAFDPDEAEGDALDALAALTGTTRDPANRTLVTNVRVVVDDNFTAVAGDMVAHLENDPSSRFVNLDSVDNTGGGDDQPFLIRFEAENTGPTVVNDGALSVIAEPLSGWDSVVNNQSPDPDDSVTTVGTNVQTDQELRESREEELRGQGGATQAAIDAALEGVDGVISVTVFFNDDDNPDSDGGPGHAIECLIYDGPTPAADNTELAQTIFDNKAAGILAFGSETHSATNVEGDTYPVSFTRPVQREVYVVIDVTPDPDNPNPNLVSEVEGAVVAGGTARATPGRDVYGDDVGCDAKEVTGVLTVDMAGGAVRLGFSPAPASTANLTIASRELATFSTARVTVNVL